MAVMILVWNFLIWFSFGSPVGEYQKLSPHLNTSSQHAYGSEVTRYFAYFLSHILWFVSAMLSGWLARTRIKRHNVVSIGLLVMWVGSMLTALYQAILDSPNPSPDSENPLMIFSRVFMYVGHAAVIVNLVQLGVEQMPEPSSLQISAYIGWIVFTMNLGYWLNEIASYSLFHCLSEPQKAAYFVVVKMLQVVAQTVIVCTCLVFKGSLVSTMLTPSILHSISDVLKYASKHKHPEQRSALTYWEDEIPSRINLGMSKYGGPFTTEQVEDVKSFFRILFICLVTFLSFLAFGFNHSYSFKYNSEVLVGNITGFIMPPESPSCSYSIRNSIFTSAFMWGLVIVLLYESLYPFIHRIWPTILKRLGFALFLIVLVRLMLLILGILSTTKEIPSGLWHHLYNVSAGIIFTTSFIALMEFICAQAPSAMKNFFISFIWCLYRLSDLSDNLLLLVWSKACVHPWCVITFESFFTSLSLVGFVLYCILASKYRKRERDDPTYKRTWVEDAFSKYIADRINMKNSLNSQEHFSTTLND